MTKAIWTVDPTHSSIDFSVKHMMVSKVKGSFTDFETKISADPEDLTTADIAFHIDVNSIDTRNGDRDNHLKADDFFDAENHPKIIFESTNVIKKSDSEYDVTGELTIRGTTRQETFTVTYEGQGKDPMSGNIVAGFSGEGVVKRSDYGLNFNAKLETGGVLIGDDIKINFEIEATQES